MGLSFLEEPHAEAMAAIVSQKNAFTEVKYPVGIVAAFNEGHLHLVGFRRHRHAGGHAHHLAAIQRQHENRAFCVGIGREIFTLVVQRTVIEIGEGAEDCDPQARKVIEKRGGINAGKRLDFDGHGYFTFGCTGYTVMESPRKH